MLLGGVGLGGVALARRKPVDPLPEYTQTCEDLCFLREQEAKADAELNAAKAQQVQLEVAYQQARDYLFNQLRTEYINSKRNRSYGYLAATALGGPPVWLGMSIAIAADAAQYGVSDPVWLPDTARWSAQVNAELLSAQGEIDRIHAVNAQSCKDRLDAATTQAADAANARLAAEEKLIRLRGDYPDVTLPACRCG